MCQVQHYPIEEEANWVLAEEREADATRRRFVVEIRDILRETSPSYPSAVQLVSGAGIKFFIFFHCGGDQDPRVWASRIQIPIH
jgi:hypothetical protein